MLADAVGAPPWSRPGWTEVWARSFGERVDAVAVRGSGVLRAVAPITSGRLFGAVAAANVHTPHYVVLAADADAEAAVVCGIVEQAGGLWISRTHSAVTDRLGSALERAGAQISVRTLGDSPYIDLASSTWSEYCRSISTRARSIERERRRLSRRHGAVTVVDVHADAELDRYIDVGLELEGSGWKRRDGTAILSQRATTAFYRGVCHWAAESGFLRLSFLCAGRRAIAFDLSVESAGIVSTLKGGYDPRYSSYGPGVMLTYETIRRLFDEGATSYEFLGQSEGFKQAFASAGRRHAALHASAAGARGLVRRAAYGLHFGVRTPIVRPVAAPLVRRYRRLRFGQSQNTDGRELEF